MHLYVILLLNVVMLLFCFSFFLFTKVQQAEEEYWIGGE
jgi:hypothetical protein